MAKELFNLEKALLKTIHHVSSHKVSLVLASGGGIEDFEYRFQLVRENLTAALAQIAKIRQTAESIGAAEILRLLDEKTVPAGHDR